MPVEGTLAFGAGSKTQKRAEKSVARPTMTVFGLQSSRMIKATWDAKGVAFFSYERVRHWKEINSSRKGVAQRTTSSIMLALWGR